MINLLPPIEKEKLKLEQTKKRIIVFWSFVLLSVILLISILFGLRIYLNIQIEFQRNLLTQAKEEVSPGGEQSFQEDINLINSTFEDLNHFYQKKVSFIQIIENISEIIHNGIYLNSFSITPLFSKEETSLNVALSGFSPTRELLFELKKKLEEESISEVYFPPSNWVKPRDIDFNINFKITSQK